MSQSPLPNPVWIDTPLALHFMVGELSRQPRLAVDTESNSLYVYREQLCLIQFSIPQVDYLVDPLAIDDLSSLAPIFANHEIEKVFHAVEYDLICLKRDFGFVVVNLFDTMQAARILGYKQVGLNHLLSKKFGVIVNKRYQKADWARRPLPPDLLNYARLDTHYLLPLRDLLQAELQKSNRKKLADEEFLRLVQMNGNIKAAVPAWQRIGGTQKFSHRQLTILQELCLWRESQAERMNRPVFKVIDDKRLASIAQSAPKTNEELEQIGLSLRQVSMYGKGLLQAFERGQKSKLIMRPRQTRPAQTYLNRIEALGEWRKHTGRALGIDSDLILPKAFMQTIAKFAPKNINELAVLMPQSTWRLENFGKEILKVINP